MGPAYIHIVVREGRSHQPRSQMTRTGYFVKFGSVVFEVRERISQFHYVSLALVPKENLSGYMYVCMYRLGKGPAYLDPYAKVFL